MRLATLSALATLGLVSRLESLGPDPQRSPVFNVSRPSTPEVRRWRPLGQHGAVLLLLPGAPPLTPLVLLAEPAPCSGGRQVPFPVSLDLLDATQAGLRGELELLRQMRDLAREASNGTLNTGDRVLLDEIFQSRITALDATAQAIVLGDVALLNGSEDACLESASGSTVFLDLPDATSAGLDLDCHDCNLTIITNASSTLDHVESALDVVAESLAELAALEQALAAS